MVDEVSEDVHESDYPLPASFVKGNLWPYGRPATTLMGDPRVFRPDHHGDGHPPQHYGAIRITVAEALTLQGFRPDYPVQGTKTKQFEQVGNAVPPPLAAAVLSVLVGQVREQAA
jgi:DNA (cytosine-5)-methyltransferase 1